MKGPVSPGAGERDVPELLGRRTHSTGCPLTVRDAGEACAPVVRGRLCPLTQPHDGQDSWACAQLSSILSFKVQTFHESCQIPLYIFKPQGACLLDLLKFYFIFSSKANPTRFECSVISKAPCLCLP